MRGHWSPWQPVYYPRLSQQSPPRCPPILAHQQPCGLMGERPDAKERLRRMSEHPQPAPLGWQLGGARGWRVGENCVGPAKPYPNIPQLFRGIFYPSSYKRDTQWFPPSAASEVKQGPWGQEP